MAKGLAGCIAAVFLLVLLCCGLRQADAGPVKLTEGQVKAAYLYNFAQYVEWPAAAFANGSSPLIITVLGKSGYATAFDALGEKTVRKRRVVVRQIGSIDELGETHVLFIATSEKGQLSRILGTIKPNAVLTVSDIKGFATAGGMIGLVHQEDRVSFEINLKAARRADLKLSAHLLKLAAPVLE